MMNKVTNDAAGQSYSFRQGFRAGVDALTLHARTATPAQLEAWREAVVEWADAGGWPSPPPDLGDVERGAE